MRRGIGGAERNSRNGIALTAFVITMRVPSFDSSISSATVGTTKLTSCRITIESPSARACEQLKRTLRTPRTPPTVLSETENVFFLGTTTFPDLQDGHPRLLRTEEGSLVLSESLESSACGSEPTDGNEAQHTSDALTSTGGRCVKRCAPVFFCKAYSS